jgi:hypothetical protein
VWLAAPSSVERGLIEDDGSSEVDMNDVSVKLRDVRINQVDHGRHDAFVPRNFPCSELPHLMRRPYVRNRAFLEHTRQSRDAPRIGVIDVSMRFTGCDVGPHPVSSAGRPLEILRQATGKCWLEFVDVVGKRRMVRHFKPCSPDDEVIDLIKRPAQRAPSAGYTQGQ